METAAIASADAPITNNINPKYLLHCFPPNGFSFIRADASIQPFIPFGRERKYWN
jgi:hypothetical protein